MTSFVFLVERIAFGLYILSTGGILFMAYRLQQARRELTISQFKLEREHRPGPAGELRSRSADCSLSS